MYSVLDGVTNIFPPTKASTEYLLEEGDHRGHYQRGYYYSALGDRLSFLHTGGDGSHRPMKLRRKVNTYLLGGVKVMQEGERKKI